MPRKPTQTTDTHRLSHPRSGPPLSSAGVLWLLCPHITLSTCSGVLPTQTEWSGSVNAQTCARLCGSQWVYTGLLCTKLDFSGNTPPGPSAGQVCSLLETGGSGIRLPESWHSTFLQWPHYITCACDFPVCLKGIAWWLPSVSKEHIPFKY